MADDNIIRLRDAAKELLEINAKLAEGDDKRLQSNKDMSAILDQVVSKETDMSKLNDINADLEEQLLVAKAEGNKQKQAEIAAIKGVLKLKQKELTAQENINAAYKELGGKLGLGGLIGLVEQFNEAGDKKGGGMVQRLMIAGLLVTALTSLFQALANQTDEIGNKFGAIGVNEFQNDLMGAKSTAAGLGFSFDEMAGSVSELSDNFGVSFGEAIKISEASMDTARAIGISTTEAAKLTGLLMTIGGHSADTAQNFIKQTAALAKSAGVAPSAVMSDIAGSSEDIAGFMKDGGENIAQAAVKARSMGLALGEVTKAARGMLDFQESITAELEASVLIGRQLNLQRAREKALAGDLIGFQEEILKQVGSENDFNQMNVLQREALAKAVGMEVTQLSKLVREQGKSTAELAKMRELSIDEIISADALSMITQFGNMIKQIGLGLLQAIAFLGTFGGNVESVGGMIAGTLVTILTISIISWGLFALKTKLAGLALKAFGITSQTTGGMLGKFGKSAMTAIPILLVIAAVGASIAAIFFGMGYVIEQVAASGQGIFAIAAGFLSLAVAMSALAVAGVFAMPALLAIMGFAATMRMLGFSQENIVKLMHGPDSSAGEKSSDTEEQEQWKKDLSSMAGYLKDLQQGFGGTPAAAGAYYTQFGEAMPKTMKVTDWKG